MSGTTPAPPAAAVGLGRLITAGKLVVVLRGEATIRGSIVGSAIVPTARGSPLDDNASGPFASGRHVEVENRDHHLDWRAPEVSGRAPHRRGVLREVHVTPLGLGEELRERQQRGAFALTGRHVPGPEREHAQDFEPAHRRVPRLLRMTASAAE